jgi:CRISPR-associated protein Csb2
MMDIAVRFHGDRYAARRSDAPSRSEWPPAPDRIFQALTNSASRLETAADRAHARRWLEWLATLPAPTIIVPAGSLDEEATQHRFAPRSIVSRTTINPKQDLIDLVETQLAGSLVIFRYDAELAPEFTAIARATVANVAYLGASESPVVVTIGNATPSSDHIAYVPSDDGTVELPVPYPGRLADLDAMFAEAASAERPAWRPWRRIAGMPVRYGAAHEVARTHDAVSGDFESLIALAFKRDNGGPIIDSVYFPAFVAATRAAFLRRLPAGAHGMLSGHDAGGAAYRGAHVAFVPLADVGFHYATSRLRGVAIALPKEMDADLRREALRAFDIGEIVVGGKRYALERAVPADAQLRAMRLGTYTRRSKTWTTLTPLRLWKMPNRTGTDIPLLVAEAIRQAGYPDPAWVETDPSPFVVGGRDVRAYRHRFEKPFWLVHARFCFEREVVGPMLVGRGRYLGFGLCAPQRIHAERVA